MVSPEVVHGHTLSQEPFSKYRPCSCHAIGHPGCARPAERQSACSTRRFPSTAVSPEPINWLRRDPPYKAAGVVEIWAVWRSVVDFGQARSSVRYQRHIEAEEATWPST